MPENEQMEHNPEFETVIMGHGSHRPRVMASPQLGMTNYEQNQYYATLFIGSASQ